MRFSRIALMLSMILVVSEAQAQISSGPNAGTPVSPLMVFAVTGDHAGKNVDISKDLGPRPTIYLFVPHERLDRPLARLMRAIEKGTLEAGKDSKLVTIFLTNDEAKTKEHLLRVQMSLQFTANPLMVYPDATKGPEEWLLNSDAQLTAIVAKDGKVAASFGFRTVDETVGPEIVAALKKTLTP